MCGARRGGRARARARRSGGRMRCALARAQARGVHAGTARTWAGARARSALAGALARPRARWRIRAGVRGAGGWAARAHARARAVRRAGRAGGRFTCAGGRHARPPSRPFLVSKFNSDALGALCIPSRLFHVGLHLRHRGSVDRCDPRVAGLRRLPRTLGARVPFVSAGRRSHRCFAASDSVVATSRPPVLFAAPLIAAAASLVYHCGGRIGGRPVQRSLMASRSLTPSFSILCGVQLALPTLRRSKRIADARRQSDGKSAVLRRSSRLSLVVVVIGRNIDAISADALTCSFSRVMKESGFQESTEFCGRRGLAAPY